MIKKFLCSSVFIVCTIFAGYAQDKYQDKTLPAQERAEDLVGKLTLEEKISLMIDVSQPVDRLGIKPYNWWNEALHGVGRAGLATVFPQPIGMAASFDRDLVYHVFSAVSDEARAKNTRSAMQGSHQRYQGLTVWTPTVNIFRDPYHRWMDRVLDQTYGSSTTRRRWSSSMATGRCASPRDTSAGSTATIAAASARRGARRADVIDLHRELGVAQASVLSARRDDDSDRVPA